MMGKSSWPFSGDWRILLGDRTCPPTPFSTQPNFGEMIALKLAVFELRTPHVKWHAAIWVFKLEVVPQPEKCTELVIPATASHILNIKHDVPF
jgi:hypothetical protein